MTLEKVLKKYRKCSFKYGVHDCCLFMKDCVKASYDIDLSYIEYEGNSIEYLYKNFKELKVKNLLEFINKLLINHGFIEVSNIQNKDVLILKNENRYLAGFRINRFNVSLTQNGIIHLDDNQIVKVYRKVMSCHR